MSHHSVDWIPDELFEKVSILWTLEFGYTKYDMPTIWFEHGIPDSSIIRPDQWHDDIHYFCNNSCTYEFLKEKGLKAYHMGSIFLDRTIPTKKKPHLLVYAPQHFRFEDHDMPVEWNHPPLTREELKTLCKEHYCDDFVTTVTEDTNRDLYQDLNILFSDRFETFAVSHFAKCKYLYENAKVIYTDVMSTFDITGEQHGIKILGRDKQRHNSPYMHVNKGRKIEVLIDGKSCSRIIEKIEEIIKDYNK